MPSAASAASLEWSPRQVEIWEAIAERDPRHVLLYGGSRSGKTYMLIFSVILRALRAAGSRHLVARLNHNAIRKSVMLGTFSDVLRDRFAGVAVSLNQSDQIARFPNGS
jgi:phage terminase large subunit